jgi:hypothetical protein
MSLNPTSSVFVAATSMPSTPQPSTTSHQHQQQHSTPQPVQPEEKVYKKEKQILLEFDLKTKGKKILFWEFFFFFFWTCN